MRWITRAATAALGVGAVAAALTGAAAATSGKHVVLGHHAAYAASGKRPSPLGELPAALPPKYVVATSASVSATTGTQTRGTATCPGKTVPYGGGVFVGAISTAANVNSSFPTSTGWIADVNNATGSSTSFTVYAVCAKRNATWSIVAGSDVTVPPLGQSTATVTCPAGTRVMGGGGLSSSGSTSVNMNTSIPLSSGKGKSALYTWRVDEDNATTSAATETPYAVCGHALGYVIVIGATVSNPAGSQTEAAATCPTGKVPLGGGVFSSAGSPSVSINTTYPSSSGWTSYENNGSAGSATIIPYAVCAGT